MATYSTEGIVLQKVDYSETSLILKVLTIDHGLKSFIFQGAKRKNKKGQLVSPLSILSISYFQRKESDLGKISSIELAHIYKNIPFNPIKSSVIFFINEVLQKTIKEEESNSPLYIFIKNSLQILDVQTNISIFPIKFLLELLKHLGYYPIIENNALFFDFLNGKLTKNEPNHPNYMKPDSTQFLLQIMNSTLTSETLLIPSKDRKKIIYGILDYYKTVLGDFKALKSLDVLDAILH
jgi:DNA repair protein RecO (recombination protein O)